MKRFALAVVFLILGPVFSAQGQEIYRWVDENGVLRFADRPPETVQTGVVQEDAVPYDSAADQKRTEADARSTSQWVDTQKARSAQAEAEAQRIRDRKKAEQQQLEADKQEAEAQKQAELEARRQNKSAAKKARTRPKATPY